jgi:glycerophosphoryl diester phosphodiesterase
MISDNRSIPVIIEAHRGDSANAPENTMTAFKRAVALGVASIELDVHPALDGTLMVIHDSTVDRTTNGTGEVCSMTVKNLSSLDAGSKFAPEFVGEKIPTLEEVFKLLDKSKIKFNIEIKASPSGQNVPLTLVNLLRRFGEERDNIVSSFNLQALLEVRKIEPQIQLALIGKGPEILPLAGQHKIPWVHGEFSTVDKPLIDAAHALGMRVNIWTMDDPSRFAYWKGIGVDKI